MNNMKYNIFLKFQWEDEDKYQKMASIEDQNSNHIPQVWVEISRTKLKYYIMENVYWKYRKWNMTHTKYTIDENRCD